MSARASGVSAVSSRGITSAPPMAPHLAEELWEQLQDESHVIFDGGENARRIDVPDTDDLLIEEIKHFTKREKIDAPNHVSFLQGAGHGGSHPHLVQEFVAAIVEGRRSAVDADVAANYTCAGICAHESAMNGGKRVSIPDFEL